MKIVKIGGIFPLSDTHLLPIALNSAYDKQRVG